MLQFVVELRANIANYFDLKSKKQGFKTNTTIENDSATVQYASLK
jgi:hypothetical protein